MTTHTTKTAGIDVAKKTLDVFTGGEAFSTGNTPQDHSRLLATLAARGVERVGMEASGGYEAPLARALRAGGFQVFVLDPAQVHGYRRFRKRRAKNDKIDARLIDAVVAAIGGQAPAHDPRLEPLAELLTFTEQMRDDIACLKTRRDRYECPRLRRALDAEIKRLGKRREKEIARLVALLKAHADLKLRFELLLSIPGLGEIGALAFVVRMPELGAMTREQAAALVGLAPFDHDTGQSTGRRTIAGGRKRLRHVVFASTTAAAFHWNPMLKDCYRRLVGAGKPHKVAIVACARKLVHIANAVLARGTPWRPEPLQQP